MSLVSRLVDLGVSSEIANQIEVYRVFLEERCKDFHLTKYTSSEDFWNWHFLDSWNCAKTGFVQENVLDFGSGVGVPGVLVSLLLGVETVLCDSRSARVEFLNEALEVLRAQKIKTVLGRGEVLLKNSKKKFGSILFRAVAPPKEIFHWLSECSTWNNAFLFLGQKDIDEAKKLAQSGGFVLLCERSYKIIESDPRQRTILVVENPKTNTK